LLRVARSKLKIFCRKLFKETQLSCIIYGPEQSPITPYVTNDFVATVLKPLYLKKTCEWELEVSKIIDNCVTKFTSDTQKIVFMYLHLGSIENKENCSRITVHSILLGVGRGCQRLLKIT